MDNPAQKDLRVIDVTGNTDIVAAWFYLSNKDSSNRINKIFYADEDQADIYSVLTWTKSLPRILAAFRGDLVIGLGWVENIKQYKVQSGPKNRAEMGFGFIPGINFFTTTQAAKMMIDEIFNYDIDYIFGTTPEKNREAIAFIKRLGFNLYGPIPNYCNYLGDISGCYISYVDKENWKNDRQNKRSTDIPNASE